MLDRLIFLSPTTSTSSESISVRFSFVLLRQQPFLLPIRSNKSKLSRAHRRSLDETESIRYTSNRPPCHRSQRLPKMPCSHVLRLLVLSVATLSLLICSQVPKAFALSKIQEPLTNHAKLPPADAATQLLTLQHQLSARLEKH